MQDKWKRQRKWKRKFKVLPPDDSTERGNATAKGAGTLPLKFTPTFIHDADQRYGNIQETKRRLERFKQDTGADSRMWNCRCGCPSWLPLCSRCYPGLGALEEPSSEAGPTRRRSGRRSGLGQVRIHPDPQAQGGGVREMDRYRPTPRSQAV